MGRFDDGVSRKIRQVVQGKDGASGTDGFRSFTDGELKGILSGTDDQQGAGGGQCEDAGFFGHCQGSRDDLAHAAGGTEVSLVSTDRADRCDGFESFIPGSGIHRLIAAAAGSGNANSLRINFGA